MATYSSEEETYSREDCLANRKRNERNYEREMHLEKCRMADAVKKFDEDYPTVKEGRTTECQACSKALVVPNLDGLFCKAFMQDENFELEEDEIGHRVGLSLTLCCGKCVCMECFSKYSIETCPSCEIGTMPSQPSVTLSKTIQYAREGNAWAQFEAGVRMLEKGEGSRNKKEKQKLIKQGVDWCVMAAEQGVGAAAAFLVIRKRAQIDEESKYRHLLNMAAEMGDPQAQMILGATIEEEGGDLSSAVNWYTLSLSSDFNSAREMAAFNLADSFRNGDGGLDKSLARAKHYYQIASDGGAENACFYLGRTLFELGKDTLNCPGSDPIPRILYWATESLKRGDTCDASHVATGLMNLISQQNKCFVCDEEGTNLSRCSKCQLFYYCGPECQRRHWRDGHKYDCVEISLTSLRRLVTERSRHM